jgi:hypothetical protein
LFETPGIQLGVGVFVGGIVAGGVGGVVVVSEPHEVGSSHDVIHPVSVVVVGVSSA